MADVEKLSLVDIVAPFSYFYCHQARCGSAVLWFCLGCWPTSGAALCAAEAWHAPSASCWRWCWCWCSWCMLVRCSACCCAALHHLPALLPPNCGAHGRPPNCAAPAWVRSSGGVLPLVSAPLWAHRRPATLRCFSMGKGLVVEESRWHPPLICARPQVAAILRCFSMGEELVRAAALLFTRCADLEENIDQLTSVMQVRLPRGGRGLGARLLLHLHMAAVPCVRLNLLRAHQHPPACPTPQQWSCQLQNSWTGTGTRTHAHMHMHTHTHAHAHTCTHNTHTQERDIHELHQLLGWFSYFRFSNPTGGA